MRVSASLPFILAGAALVSACASSPRSGNTLPPAAFVGNAADQVSEAYIIGPLDEITVFVWRNNELGARVQVRPDGRITTPLISDMVAAGKTPAQLAEDIRGALTQYVQDPLVSVMVDRPQGTFSQQVRIVGATERPAAIPYRANMTLLDAMIAVGGLSEFAAGDRARLIRYDRATGRQREFDLQDRQPASTRRRARQRPPRTGRRHHHPGKHVLIRPALPPEGRQLPMEGLYDQFRLALHQVWRRRWLAMAVAWGIALLGWLVIALIPNSYEAKARMFVQMSSILQGQIGITSDERQNQLLRLKQTLTSNENLVRVVRRTDLNSLVASESDLSGVVASLRQRIAILAHPDGMLEITARSNVSGFSNGQNARTAAATAQALVDLFIEQNLSGDRRETGQSLQFLDEELRRRETQLQEAEQRRVEFEQRFTGLLPGSGSIAQRMAAARAELANIEQQIIAAQGSIGAMRGQLNSTPSTLPGSDGANTASGQLASLEAQLNQYRARGYTDQHPDVVATRQQIARDAPARRGRAAQRRRRHSQSELRLAARDDGRARGAARRGDRAAQPDPGRPGATGLAPVERARPGRRAGAAQPRL